MLAVFCKEELALLKPHGETAVINQMILLKLRDNWKRWLKRIY